MQGNDAANVGLKEAAIFFLTSSSTILFVPKAQKQRQQERWENSLSEYNFAMVACNKKNLKRSGIPSPPPPLQGIAVPKALSFTNCAGSQVGMCSRNPRKDFVKNVDLFRKCFRKVRRTQNCILLLH